MKGIQGKEQTCNWGDSSKHEHSVIHRSEMGVSELAHQRLGEGKGRNKEAERNGHAGLNQ